MTNFRGFSIIVLGVAVLIVTGCGKDKDKTGGDPAVAAKPATPTATAWLAVPGFGVQLEVPADAAVDPGGSERQIEIGSPTFYDCKFFLIKENLEMADSFEKVSGQIKEGRMGNNKLRVMKKEEKSEDGGWNLEWEADGSLDPKDTTYGVDYRVVIDGTTYGCVRRTSTPEGQACVAKACGSLKKI